MISPDLAEFVESGIAFLALDAENADQTFAHEKRQRELHSPPRPLARRTR